MLKSEPWYLSPQAAADLEDLLSLATTRRVPPFPQRKSAVRGDLGIVEIVGPLVRRSDPLSSLLGLQSYGNIISEVRKHQTDAAVAGIALVIDSGGGLAAGCREAAEAIAAAAKIKPVVALVDGYCASAAYFLASGANRIFASPDALVGSVGTIFRLVDASKMLERAGITPHVISTGTHKAAGDPSLPMSDEWLTYFDGLVSNLGRQFLDHVTMARNLTSEQRREVRAARVYLADEARAVGLVDEVAYASTVLSAMRRRYAPEDETRLYEQIVALGPVRERPKPQARPKPTPIQAPRNSSANSWEKTGY